MKADESPITDASSQANHCVLKGPDEPDYSTSAPNNFLEGSYTFDGQDDWCDTPNINPTNELSLMTWVNNDSVNNGKWISEPAANGSWVYPYANYMFGIVQSSSEARLWITSGGTLYEVSSGIGYVLDTGWHHYGVTRSGIAVKFFRDGVQYGSDKQIGTSGNIDDSGERLTVGNRSSSSSGEVLDGSLTEVALFTRALTEAEILELVTYGLDGQSGSSVPAAPILNSANPGDAEVTLSWSSVADADSYTVKYGTSSGSYDTTIPVGNNTEFTVTELTNGTTYYFVATASNQSGESPDSNELSSVPVVGGGVDYFVKNVKYNKFGQITNIVYGNDTETTYTYEELTNRLSNIFTLK